MNQTAFEDVPDEWTAVTDESRLEGSLIGAQAGGVGVLLVRSAGGVHALADRCSHRGCALHRGKPRRSATPVTCPCHGSTFRLDGSIVKGPATAAQPSFKVRTNAGVVEVMRTAPS